MSILYKAAVHGALLGEAYREQQFPNKDFMPPMASVIRLTINAS